MLIGLALLIAQVVGPQAYLTINPDDGSYQLATQDGRFTLTLDSDCGDLPPGNVEWLPGSHNAGAIQPIGSDAVCGVQLTGRVSDDPCSTTDGACDIVAELANQ